MNDILQWSMVIGVGGGVPIITILTFYMSISSSITDAKNAAATALKDVAEVKQDLRGIEAKHEDFSNDLKSVEIRMTGELAALSANSRSLGQSIVDTEVRLNKSFENMTKLVENLREETINLRETVIRTYSEQRRPIQRQQSTDR